MLDILCLAGLAADILKNDSDNQAAVRANDSNNMAMVAGGLIAAGLVGYGLKKFSENTSNKPNAPRLNSGK